MLHFDEGIPRVLLAGEALRALRLSMRGLTDAARAGLGAKLAEAFGA